MHGPKNTTAFEKKVFSQENLQVATSSQGFTIIELIMVVVLISILAVSVVPKFMDTSAISLQGGAAMAVADIRYTQELAMSTSTHAAKSITFAADDDFYMVASQRMDLPSRVTVECVSGTGEFKFNSLGEPIIGGGELVKIKAGDNCKAISVVDGTGNVSVSDSSCVCS